MAFDPLILTTSLAVAGVIAAIFLVLSVRKYPKGNEKMIAIWTAIREGSNAYLKRQFRTIAIIAIIIALVIVAAFGATVNFTYGGEIGLSFLLGVAFSLFAAYVALYSATNANVRSTAAAEKSTYEALKVATLGGGALGLVVISMSLLGLSLLYAIFRDPGVLAGFGFGASLAALFAQLGGGIFTKSADVGADLVGKVEENFPEDDPRNPAAIADNVGDNVGDEAGRGADLFESLTAENLGGMIIGLIVSIIIFNGVINPYYVTMPLIVRSLGIIATFVGLAVAVFEKKFKNPIKPTRDGLLVASVVAAILMFIADERREEYFPYRWERAYATPHGSMGIFMRADETGREPVFAGRSAVREDWPDLLDVARLSVFDGWLVLGCMVLPLVWVGILLSMFQQFVADNRTMTDLFAYCAALRI